MDGPLREIKIARPGKKNTNSNILFQHLLSFKVRQKKFKEDFICHDNKSVFLLLLLLSFALKKKYLLAL
jgi:hypothetical protein